MITFTISAMRCQMLLMESRLLGGSVFGNGSYFSKCAQQRYPLRHYRAYKRWYDRTIAILLGDDMPKKGHAVGPNVS